jgi:membrane fusion protein (multidrug efflux system)
VENNEASYKVAAANFDNAKTRLSYCRIRAPFSGFITKKFLDRGALVQTTNSVIFTLMKMDSVKVVVNIQEKHIPFISRGRKTVITVDALPGKKFYGVVGRIGQALDLATRTLPVEVNILNKAYELKPGMFAGVEIIMDAHKNALVVPNDAVMKDKKSSYVFINENGKARRADVSIGLDQDGYTEILSGLSGSEDVITTGQQFVRNGGKVKEI